MRDARSKLDALLRSAALKRDRFELRYCYREAHRLTFDAPSSDGFRGYDLIVQSKVTTPTDRPVDVHVCGQPAEEENCFTRHKLLLPPRTELYVIDADISGLWKLVVHPGDEPGEFVGWIKMGELAYIPAVPSSTVAAIVLEQNHSR